MHNLKGILVWFECVLNFNSQYLNYINIDYLYNKTMIAASTRVVVFFFVFDILFIMCVFFFLVFIYNVFSTASLFIIQFYINNYFISNKKIDVEELSLVMNMYHQNLRQCNCVLCIILSLIISCIILCVMF